MYLTNILCRARAKYYPPLIYPKFVSRTVLMEQSGVEQAIQVLNRIMNQEGIIDQFRRTQRYEKPYQARRRINYQKAKAIYDEEMERKIKFLLRKNREHPWVGCY